MIGQLRPANFSFRVPLKEADVPAERWRATEVGVTSSKVLVPNSFDEPTRENFNRRGQRRAIAAIPKKLNITAAAISMKQIAHSTGGDDLRGVQQVKGAVFGQVEAVHPGVKPIVHKPGANIVIAK